jgi:hypothetical protein
MAAKATTKKAGTLKIAKLNVQANASQKTTAQQVTRAGKSRAEQNKKKAIAATKKMVAEECGEEYSTEEQNPVEEKDNEGVEEDEIDDE